MAYTPPVGSPLANGTHPRLHVTNWATVRAKIAGDASFLTNLQTVMTYCESRWTSDPYTYSAGVISNVVTSLYAFVARVLEQGDLGTHTKTAAEYLAKAIAGVNGQAALPATGATAGTTYYHAGEGYWYATGYWTQFLLAYDWCYNSMSSSERTTAATHIADAMEVLRHSPPVILWEEGDDRIRLYSSPSKEGVFCWLGALAIYGDGVRDADALDMLDDFGTYALNGGILDALNWQAEDNGGFGDVGDYPPADTLRIWWLIDAWRTATTENYFTTSCSTAGRPSGLPEYAPTHTRYYPQFMSYVMQTWNPGYYLLMGQMETRVGGIPRLSTGGRGQNQIARTFINHVDSNMAALQQWICELFSINTYSWTSNYPTVPMWYCLLDTHTIAAKTPAQVGLTRSKFFKGMGLTIVRDGWPTVNDGSQSSQAMFHCVAFPYYYVPGHAFSIGAPSSGGIYGAIPEIEPVGFSIQKYGPLFQEYYSNMRYTSTTWWHHRRNVTRVTDPAYNGLWGGFRCYGPTPSGLPSDSSQNNILECINEPQDRWKLCTHVRRYMDDNLKIYSVLINQTNLYMPGRVSFDKRHYTYLNAGDPVKSDYLVIKERINTSGATLRTRFELCSVAPPTFNGTSAGITSWNGYSSDASSHIQTTDSSVATFSNYTTSDPLRPAFNPYANGCNGKAVVTYLLPSSRKLTRVGGSLTSYFLSDSGNQYAKDITDAQTSTGTTYTGGCYTDCEPATQTTTTDFLVVIQACRNDVAATTVSSVTINSGNMHGAFIDDADEKKVVLFTTRGNTTATVSTEVESAVNYTIIATGTVRHVLNDMDDSLMFDVAQGGVPIVTAQTPVEGVLTFTSTNGGTFAVTTGAPASPVYFVFRK